MATCLALLATALGKDAGAQASSTETSPRHIRIGLVGDAYSSEMKALLQEWLTSIDITAEVSWEAHVSIESLRTQQGRESARVFVTLQNVDRAVVYFADEGGQRFLLRDVELQNGLDELGREKLAQIILSSAPSFLDRELETPLNAVSEQLERESSGSSVVAPQAAPAQPPTRRVQLESRPSVPIKSYADATGPGSDGSRLTWLVDAGLEATTYAGEGAAYSLSVGLSVLPPLKEWCMGFAARGQYQFPHLAQGRTVDLRLTSSGVRFGFAGGACHGGWGAELGGGVNWVAFEPRSSREGVDLGSDGRDTVPILALSLLHSWDIRGGLRAILGAGTDVALVKTHYDVEEPGGRRRDFTAWVVQPRVFLRLAFSGV